MTYYAGCMNYKELNADIKKEFSDHSEVCVNGVLGQRYMGSALKPGSVLKIYGTPGNDLGCYNDGGFIEVFGNAQEGTANTMNAGSIIIPLGAITISLSGLAVAAIVGIVMNAILPGKDYEFGVNEAGDNAVNFGSSAYKDDKK